MPDVILVAGANIIPVPFKCAYSHISVMRINFWSRSRWIFPVPCFSYMCNRVIILGYIHAILNCVRVVADCNDACVPCVLSKSMSRIGYYISVRTYILEQGHICRVIVRLFYKAFVLLEKAIPDVYRDYTHISSMPKSRVLWRKHSTKCMVHTFVHPSIGLEIMTTGSYGEHD